MSEKDVELLNSCSQAEVLKWVSERSKGDKINGMVAGTNVRRI